MTVSVKAKSLSPYRPFGSMILPGKEEEDSQYLADSRKSTRKSFFKRTEYYPHLMQYSERISRGSNEEQEGRKEKNIRYHTSVEAITREEYNQLKDIIEELDSKTNFLQMERRDLHKRNEKLQFQNDYYKSEIEDLCKQVENLTQLYEIVSSDRKNQTADKRVMKCLNLSRVLI